jgi:nitroreductase
MDALELMLGRNSAVKLQDPGPDDHALDVMFRSALRAPDHGRMRPWRFIVIAGAERERFGELMAGLLQARQPDATPDMLTRERSKPLRAPVIVVVAAHTRPSDKIPEVEQLLSAGAAAQNIMLAAHALGYGAMWKTGAPAYDDEVKRVLGLEPADSIVGFIYLGTRVGGASPLPRPEPQDLVTRWRGQG